MLLRLLIITAALHTVQSFESPGRIIGGTSTTINKHPYQVAISYNNVHQCGGSIIGSEWILTAAHCVYGLNKQSLKIRIGSTFRSKEGELIEDILSVISHELYDEDSFDYDVALIKLKKAIKFNSTKRNIGLASASMNIVTGSNCIITGWGKTTPTGSMSDSLRALSVPVIDWNVCKTLYALHNPVTARMLCAGYTTGDKDTCQGDSGGPLVYNNIQIGIVSWGAECASKKYPGVYTSVPSVRSWIKSKTGL